MRVEESIGLRVRTRRDELGMKQEELGRRLQPLLGKAWSRQTVSMAEQGTRAWAAADLVAVAIVLETTVGDLIRPPIEATEVELGGENPVPRDILFVISTPRPREDMNLTAIQETFSRLGDSLAQAQESVEQSRKRGSDLERYFMERVAGGGVVRSPTAEPGVDPIPQNREKISPDGDR